MPLSSAAKLLIASRALFAGTREAAAAEIIRASAAYNALRRAIKQAYALDQLPSQDKVLALSQAWRPCRSLATAYLFRSAFDAAKRE